jgi:hypothetical protein
MFFSLPRSCGGVIWESKELKGAELKGAESKGQNQRGRIKGVESKGSESFDRAIITPKSNYPDTN